MVSFFCHSTQWMGCTETVYNLHLNKRRGRSNENTREWRTIWRTFLAPKNYLTWVAIWEFGIRWITWNYWSVPQNISQLYPFGMLGLFRNEQTQFGRIIIHPILMIPNDFPKMICIELCLHFTKTIICILDLMAPTVPDRKSVKIRFVTT